MVQAKFSLVNRPLSPPAQTINEMGGNVPGGNFPSWENFPGRGGESLLGGNFPGENFPGC